MRSRVVIFFDTSTTSRQHKLKFNRINHFPYANIKCVMNEYSTSSSAGRKFAYSSTRIYLNWWMNLTHVLLGANENKYPSVVRSIHNRRAQSEVIIREIQIQTKWRSSNLHSFQCSLTQLIDSLTFIQHIAINYFFAFFTEDKVKKRYFGKCLL